MNTNYLDAENDNFRQGMRAVQEAWTTMFTRLSEENVNLSKSIEELRRDNGGLQRRLQTSEREALEARQQIATCARQLEDLGSHNKVLSVQVQKWKTMTQTFQRMFTESGVDDDLPPAPFNNPMPATSGFKSFQEPGNSFLSASPPPTENVRSYANYTTAVSGTGTGGHSPVREVDTKSFLAATRERLPANEAKAVMELVKTLRFATKDEVLSKAKILMQDQDELLGQLAVICDRSCLN
jgi:hypothetical protein